MIHAEVRHLLRKHVIVSTAHGVAQLVTCMECNRVGPDAASNIVHTPKCRYATLMATLGETTKTGSRSASSSKITPTTGATEVKPAKTHDPVAAALECSS